MQKIVGSILLGIISISASEGVGRDYSTFVNKRNHSPLMKKRPESRHPVGGRRSSELSRDQRGGPSLGREPPSMPTVSIQS
jgi:hypothetical protein